MASNELKEIKEVLEYMMIHLEYTRDEAEKFAEGYVRFLENDPIYKNHPPIKGFDGGANRAGIANAGIDAEEFVNRFMEAEKSFEDYRELSGAT